VNKLIYVFSRTSIGYRGCFFIFIINMDNTVLQKRGNLVRFGKLQSQIYIFFDLNLSAVRVNGTFKNGGGAEIYFYHE
jgi:hypothetical protein